jgi:hypothetical protein
MRGISRFDRRVSLVLNYLSVAVIATVIDMRGALGWGTSSVGLIAIGALALGVATFVRVFWHTKLWRITHAGFRSLDERQVQVVYGALRSSYWIFAIACVVILYANALIERGHIPILVAAAVLYLAHTLPAAVVAWTEKEVLIGQ